MVANGGQISQVLQQIAAISQRALADAVQGLRASALEALEAQPRLMLAAGPVASGALDVFTEVASAFQRAHAPGTERGDVWAVVKSGDLEAAERLIKRWRPWPYDRRAQGILKMMPFSAKMSLLEKLPQDLVDETTRLKREPRRWHDNRVWLKENGRPAEITVRELTLTFFVRQLRTIALKVNTSAILSSLNSYPLKDTHGKTPSYESQLLDSGSSPEARDFGGIDCLLADSPDDSCDTFVDRDSLESSEAAPGIGTHLDILARVATPRDLKLLDEIRLQYSEGRAKPNGKPNLAAAGRAIRMNPTTARGLWRNLKKKASKAATTAS